jgi:NosR/NirI family nitrous oxide reductase transcriptional regulator
MQPDYKIKNKKYSWNELVSLGSIKKILVHTEQVGLPKSDTPFIEMWFGDLNHPDVGISLLGKIITRICVRI